jgi:hypothetical protein
MGGDLRGREGFESLSLGELQPQIDSVSLYHFQRVDLRYNLIAHSPGYSANIVAKPSYLHRHQIILTGEI